MLADNPINPIDVVLLAPDLEASRRFYADQLGLEVFSESQSAVVFGCGGGTRIILSASTMGTADEQTQASWRVEDLAAELAELRSCGVEVIEYDLPGLKTENGIFDGGDELHAWIGDPGNNVLSINQAK